MGRKVSSFIPPYLRSLALGVVGKWEPEGNSCLQCKYNGVFVEAISTVPLFAFGYIGVVSRVQSRPDGLMPDVARASFGFIIFVCYSVCEIVRQDAICKPLRSPTTALTLTHILNHLYRIYKMPYCSHRLSIPLSIPSLTFLVHRGVLEISL